MKNKSNLEEGFGKNLVITISVLASMMAIHNVVSAKEVEDILKKDSSYEHVIDAMKSKAKKTYGKFSEIDSINAVARTLYVEGGGESSLGKKYIATAIWNRAGGDVNKIALVCLKPKQFSCWDRIDNAERDGSEFKYKIPDSADLNSKNKKIWEECKELATSMHNGTFEPVNKFITSYYNPKTAKHQKWMDELTHKETIGNHIFGRDASQDGYRKTTKTEYKPQGKIYTVKSGDNLSTIAKRLKVSTNDLVKQNPNLKKNPNKISIGQKIKY